MDELVENAQEGGERRPGRWPRPPSLEGPRNVRGGQVRAAALGLLFFALLPLVHAGTFISGSVRWEQVTGKPNTARFDIVTYWRRSFSPFKGGNAMPGDEIDVIAQSTVSISYGDGSPARYLRTTVTNINTDEDWLEAVATYEHTYAAPYADKQVITEYVTTISETGNKVESVIYKPKYTPWVASVRGCCRYATLSNDADKPFVIRTTVNLETSSRSPDARVLPIISVKIGESIKAKISAPLYLPPQIAPADQKTVLYSWCPSSSWSPPAASIAALNPATGTISWLGTTVGWYHLCLNGQIDNVEAEVLECPCTVEREGERENYR